jgi:hypothetical protein
MSEFAKTMKWKIDKKSARLAENQESPRVNWRVNNGTVTLVKNSTLRNDYFVIKGTVDSEVAPRIQDRFPCYELAQIVSAVAQPTSEDQRVDALYLVAAAAPSDYDETIFRAISESADHSHSKVRLAAVVAARYLGWTQLRPVVEERSESDTSEVVRDLSWNALVTSSWDRGQSAESES